MARLCSARSDAADALGPVARRTRRSQSDNNIKEASQWPPYIGTPTSRVDGRAKVTGAAKYAAEFNSAGLAYGSVVSSTIARGRILRIDPSEALRVDGVIDVLTHEHRPRMADTDGACKDEVAPEEGTPFRPVYGGKIMFSG